MEKPKTKDKSKYVERLCGEAKRRYEEKIGMINGFDPYDSREKDWSTEENLLPPLTYCDMVNYLVFGRSAYTMDEFKSYKTLDSHVQFTNGWVHELKIFSPDDCDRVVVKAKVLHSQRLNEKALLPWVIIQQDGAIVCGHCDCMAGLAETCTHLGALLFKIEAVVRIRERPTVTGVPAYWMVPAGITKVEPEVCHKIDYTSAATKKKHFDKAIDSGTAPPQQTRTGCTSKTATPAPTQQEVDSLFHQLHLCGDRAGVLSVVPEYCENFKDPIKPVLMPKSLRCLRNTNCDKLTKPELQEYCEKLHDRVKVTTEEAHKVENDTKEQHNTPSWFAARAGRVTASHMHAVCTFKVDKPALSTITSVCYPGQKKANVPAARWGIQNEGKARGAYEQKARENHFGVCLDRSGFVINPDIPYMGASPDGLVVCECCGKGCLEIKCPYKHRNASIEAALQDESFCLSSVGGSVLLKKTHPYYYQVQCQLLVSQADYCDFVVWTTEDIVIVRVEPDFDFMAHCKSKAQAFFADVVLPELVAKYYTNMKHASIDTHQPHPCTSQKRALSQSPQKTSTACNKQQAKRAARQYCICDMPEEYDDMVACDNSECEIEWFHVSCVGLTHLPGKDETWFCSACLS